MANQRSSASSKTLSTGAAIFQQFSPLPKLIVFDLDYTLWPYWVDTHIALPIKKTSDGTVRDARNSKLKIYPEVIQVLEALKENNILVAAASRTQEPPAARDMLKYFNLDKYFDFREIYPGVKTTHFQKIKRDSNVPYEEMLFFDDESRNIVDISKINVVCYLVKTEVNMAVLQEGLALFAEKRKTK